MGDLINCLQNWNTLVDWLIDFPELHAVCCLRFLLVFSFRHSTLDSHLHSTVQYSTLKYNCTVLYCELCSTVLYCTVQYYTLLYCSVLYCTVLYSIVQHCTVLYSSSTVVSTKHNLSFSQSSKTVEYNGFMLVKQALNSNIQLIYGFEHILLLFIFLTFVILDYKNFNNQVGEK